ncbi:hypothetical protein FJR48_09735 [Sulfurimonas lithotrophica]|uniref:HmuY protein n=1 Tax=Sulfurimonas lithotrophica TaxID=2590022 RepID=A0A5P8P2Q5_9BACT|nr:HmuY family protein [Sulfurimonas lithotrophica]QFR49989.1 hypothetical protein FJR48_09735 [Sulfurimonas lithotrophica]
MKLNKMYILSTLVSSMLILSGCGGDSGSSAVVIPNQSTAETTSMDASSGAETKFNLSSGLVDSTTWHFAYQKYLGFKTNGGSSGNGSITACVAKTYADLYDTNNNSVQSEFEALNATNTLSDFEAVSMDDCNSSAYIEDSIDTQIETSTWLDASYGPGGPVFSAKTDSNNSYIIRSADGNSYARVKVKSVDVNLSAGSRKLVLSSELWNGTAWTAAQDSPELDFSSSKAYWDLETNGLSDAANEWELAVSVAGQDYPLQVNGGASGDGNGGVGLVINEDATTVTDPTNTSEVYTYFADSATGALSSPGSYGPLEYGVAGGHLMWPTFAVYIIDDGVDKYKFQIISNNGQSGALSSGNLVIRYQKLD